jgi:hypothetical protein
LILPSNARRNRTDHQVPTRSQQAMIRLVHRAWRGRMICIKTLNDRSTSQASFVAGAVGTANPTNE